MNKHEQLLKHLVGEEGFHTLSKVIQRKQTSNVADPLELYLPLLAVPRAILSWLVQNIRPIPVNETKTLDFPGKDDIKIEIRKLDTDVYAGEFIQDGKVIHTFNRQTLPSLGGHLMTVGELYDDIVDDEKIGTTVSKLFDLTKPEKDSNEESKEEEKEEEQEHKMIDQSADHMSAMTAIVGKLIDALVANHLTPKTEDKSDPKKEDKDEDDKEGDDVSKDEMRPQKLKEALKEHTVDKVKQPKDTYKDSQKEKKKDPTLTENPHSHSMSKEEMEKAGGFNRAGGTAAPMKPKMPVPPVPAGSAPQAMGAAAKQTQQAMQGKQPKASISGSNKPITGMDRKQTSSNKMGVTTAASPQAMTTKEDPLDMTPRPRTLSLRKLKRTRKSEKSTIRYGVSEEEMMSKCVHCGIPEFTKNEKDNYKFTPCHCFTVMEKSENGRASWFVRIAKSETGFNLDFNPKADQESVRAFLLTIKSTMKKRG